MIIQKEQSLNRDKDDNDGDGDYHLRGDRYSNNSIGVHDSIAKDVSELLNGKDVNELDDLEKDINKNIRDGHGTDIEYWELLKTEISIQRSKAVVDAIHQDLMKQYLNMNREVKAYLIANNIISDNKNSSDTKDQDNDDGEINSIPSSHKIVLNEELDEREEKMKISDEIQVTTTNYWWKDKYRPRKPRYFNRVKTGWDRTKYNLTHYDKDNPPPKMIQGYKFTLFFPDLIDKQKTPRYFLEPCHEGN
jgi:membrane-associated HD superfamily phosphohydrolase